MPVTPGGAEQDREAAARCERSHRRERPPLACYANYFEVGHNAFEFLLDAGQVEPQSGEIQLLSRIAVSPVHAKLLAQMLAQSIDQFERAHHDIPDLSEDEVQADLAFTSPHEFERRAIDARRRPARPVVPDPSKR